MQFKHNQPPHQYLYLDERPLPPVELQWVADDANQSQPLPLFSTNIFLPSLAPMVQPAEVVFNDYIGLSELWPPVSPVTLPLSFASFFPSSQATDITSRDVGSISSPFSSASEVDSPTATNASMREAEGRAQVIPVDAVSGGVTASRRLPHRRLCKCACVPCRNAKTACDESRPCNRCRTQRDPSLCVDRPGEEVERGRLKRRRKPNTTTRPSAQQQQCQIAASRCQQLIPFPPITTPAHTRDNITSQASAACLAAAQSTSLRELMLGTVERLVRTKGLNAGQLQKAVRAVQLGLAHMADHLNVEHFNAFLQSHITPTASNLPTTTVTSPLLVPAEIVPSAPDSMSAPGPSPPSSVPLPLPTILQAWSHPITRPMFLEWSSTPLMCASTEEGANAETATVHICFLPGAKANMMRYEQRNQLPQSTATPSTSTTPTAVNTLWLNQLVESEADGSDISQVNAKLSCLAMDDKTTSTASNSHTTDSPFPHRSHASWCSVHRLSLLPSERSCEDASTSACTCKDSMLLPCTVLVNAAWERLFGYSQKEVRSDFLRCGMRAESVWFRLDSWLAYHILLGRHLRSNGAGSDFRTFAIVRTKWATELSCIVHKQLVCGDDGSTSSTLTFTPLTANMYPGIDAEFSHGSAARSSSIRSIEQ